MRTVLTADSLWNGSKLIPYPVVEIEGGRIAAITEGFGARIELPGAEVHNFKGATLAPAFLDVHIHGAAGHDVMEATPQALDAMGRFLASRGTANYLATTVTASLDVTLRSLEGLARLIAQQSEMSSGKG